MTAVEHNKYLAIGFAIFAAIFAFTFLLLMLVSLGVFVGLGISLANQAQDPNQLATGLFGGVFAVVFYLVLGLIFVLPLATASRKLWKRRRRARAWAIIAAIIILWMIPIGTALAVYALWFCFGVGKELYIESAAVS